MFVSFLIFNACKLPELWSLPFLTWLFQFSAFLMFAIFIFFIVFGRTPQHNRSCMVRGIFFQDRIRALCSAERTVKHVSNTQTHQTHQRDPTHKTHQTKRTERTNTHQNAPKPKANAPNAPNAVGAVGVWCGWCVLCVSCVWCVGCVWCLSCLWCLWCVWCVWCVWCLWCLWCLWCRRHPQNFRKIHFAKAFGTKLIKYLRGLVWSNFNVACSPQYSCNKTFINVMWATKLWSYKYMCSS